MRILEEYLKPVATGFLAVFLFWKAGNRNHRSGPNWSGSVQFLVFFWSIQPDPQTLFWTAIQTRFLKDRLSWPTSIHLAQRCGHVPCRCVCSKMPMNHVHYQCVQLSSLQSSSHEVSYYIRKMSSLSLQREVHVSPKTLAVFERCHMSLWSTSFMSLLHLIYSKPQKFSANFWQI